jgi:hypothetical protein
MRKLAVFVVLIFAVVTLINTYSSNTQQEFVTAQTEPLKLPR